MSVMMKAMGLDKWLDERVIYAGKVVKRSQIRATIEELKRLRARRVAMAMEGLIPEVLLNPAWLVDIAINRKAGWPEDPGYHGSAMPLPDGSYPPKAQGDRLRHLTQLAHKINTPRLIVREGDLGDLRPLARKRFPGRITWADDE